MNLYLSEDGTVVRPEPLSREQLTAVLTGGLVMVAFIGLGLEFQSAVPVVPGAVYFLWTALRAVFSMGPDVEIDEPAYL